MSERSPETSRPRSGTWIVLALVLLGVAAAATAFIYWKGVARRTFPATQPGETTGPVAWDRAAAEKERAELAQRLIALENEPGDPAPLIRDTRRLVEKYPRFAAGHTFLAQVLFFAHDLEGGYAQLQESLKIDSQQAEVHELAGTIALELKRDDEAGEHYTMAANLAPNSSHFRVNLAVFYLNHKDYDRAMTTLLEAIRTDSSSYEAYAALADLYARQGKLDQAIDQYSKAIAVTPLGNRPDVFTYLINKAMLQRRANRPEDSLRTLEALNDRERAEPLALEGLATSWAQLKDFRHAAQVYEEALRPDPSRWPFEIEATRYRIKAGDFDQAEAHIQTLEAFKEKLPAIADLRAELKAARERVGK